MTGLPNELIPDSLILRLISVGIETPEDKIKLIEDIFESLTLIGKKQILDSLIQEMLSIEREIERDDETPD